MVAPSKPRRSKRVNVALKVNLQYPDRETFSERFAQNLSRSGIFIRAKDPVPVGTKITFEYRLADDSRVLRGVGLVRWIRRQEDASEPDDPPGMGIEFVDVDAETDELITDIVAKFGEGARAPKRERTATSRVLRTPTTDAAAELPSDTSFDDEELDVLDALGPGPAAPPKEESAPAEPPADTDLDATVDLSIDPSPAPPAPETDDEEAFEVELDADPATEAEESFEVELDADPTEEEIEVETSAPEEAVATPSPSVSAAVVVLDFMGDELHIAPVVDGQLAPDDARRTHRLIVSPDADASDTSIPGLHSLIRWLGQSTNHAAMASAARRTGVTLTVDGSEATVSFAGAETSVGTLMAASLDEALPAEAETVRLTVPAGTPKEAKAFLADQLKVRGLVAQLIPAAQVATRLSPDAQTPALMVHVEAGGCVLSYWDGAQSFDVPLATGSLWDLDVALRNVAALALLREHEMDAGDDPSLQEDLQRQVRAKRRESAPFPWEVSIAGAPVELSPESVDAALTTWAESVGSVLEGLGLQHDHSARGAGSVMLLTTEPLPPGAAEHLERVMGTKVVTIQLDTWTRCEVLAGA